MHLSWIIQGPTESAWSYFTQIKLFTKYLNYHGHTAQVISFTNLQADIPVILKAIATAKPDLLLAIGDTHILNLAKVTRIPLISIVTNGTGRLEVSSPIPSVTFACTSRYAQKLYQSAGISPTPYLPHGFDPQVFFPSDRMEARKQLKLSPTRPLILMVGTNYPLNPHDEVTQVKTPSDRKNWLGGLMAFKTTLLHQPSAQLYLHTNAVGAINLPQVIKKLNLTRSVILADKSQTAFPNPAINTMPQSHLARLYRAANVLLFPSYGESFGVPLIEAQACGTPVVCTNAGPLSELIQTGTAVATNPHPAHPGWGIPETAALSKALLQWLQTPLKPPVISGLIQPYAADHIVTNQFTTIIKESIHGHR